MRDNRQQIIIVNEGSPGLAAGICGCIFATLGIFTLGIIFVPIAALCSVIGLLRGAARWNLAGFGLSALSAVLTLVGFIASPSLLLMAGLTIASHQDQRPEPKASVTAAPVVDAQITNEMTCPVGGGSVTLSGVASKQAVGDRPNVWVLRTERPFCLTVNPPVAPTQRVALSAVEIEGQAPPSGFRIELNGILYPGQLLPTGELMPVLVVKSGRRLK